MSKVRVIFANSSKPPGAGEEKTPSEGVVKDENSAVRSKVIRSR
jgi:hypothetical protein